MITTGFPNGQRASAWGDGWLELREPGDASDVLFQPDPVSPDQYGDVNTVEQQERYIEGELLSIEDVASQGWIQSDSSSGVAFESPEYAQTNDGSFAPSRGSIPLAPENEGEVYQTLLWAAGKVALTGIGLFLAAGSSPALALIGAGLTAYSAYSLFQSYQSYISDLVPMLSEQVAKFNVESVDVDSWKEFESYTVERTDEFVIEAAGSQAWTLEVLPAIFARHSDISMKVVVPGGEISGDDHSNRALLTMVDDLYDAKDGRDIVLGQLGDDTLGGGGGDDIVLGGAGNDRVAGGAGSDVLMGGGGDDEIDGDNGSDISFGGNGNDTFFGGDGADLLIGDQGNDTIKLDGTTYFRTSFFAYNAGSVNQIGTHVKQSIAGLKKLDVVSHGGDQTDIVELSSGSDAFFLHDSFSNFHSEVALTEDSAGRASAPRFTDIEAIFGRDGDDLIDLTSPDYSMQGLQMEIYGGSGNDIIWGSDADEIIYGGDGNDIIFAGAGTDLVLGGAGADRFELTGTSTALRIGDFNPQEGDTIRFYNNDRATVLREEGFDSVFFNAVDFTLRLIVDTPTERYYPIVDLMPVEPDNALPIQGVLSVFEDVTLYEY